MNDAPVKLVTISGIFVAPDNRPVPGVTLQLRTRKYTNRLLQNELISCITDMSGAYSFSVLPGDYEASCVFKPAERAGVLGVVHIEPGAPDGTLNDFLGLTAGMTYPPSIMVKIIEWVDLAEYYAEQAKINATTPVNVVPTNSDLPAVKVGFYLIENDTDKGGSQLYYFVNDKKYWLAMVEDN